MMAWLRRVVARAKYRHHAADLAEELDHHRTLAEQAFIDSGAPAADAKWQAQRALGSDARAREDARAVWLAPWLDQTLQDVRNAWRQMRRAPSFALTAVLLSGLGVGTTTAVFSVANAVLFVALPYPQADRILALGTGDGGAVDGQTYHAVLARQTSFCAVAAQRGTGGWSFVSGSHAEAVAGLRVSAGYFDVLGVTPQIGRALSADEDSPGGASAVVLSADLWRRALGGRPDVLGQQVLLGGTAYVVVGVMPDGFRSTPPVDVWTPIRLSERDNSLNYLVVGRLAQGIPSGRADAELELVKGDLTRTTPEPAHARIRSLAWQPLQTRLGMELTLPMLLLVLAVAAVSTVACANLAGLLLFRTLARAREVATRLALGGSRGRIVRQFLTEGLVLAGLGGTVGLVLVVWLVPMLTRSVPAALLVGRTITIDGRVLAVATGVTVLVGLVFGLTPALAARRFDLRQVLAQTRTSTAGPGGSWARRLLHGGEIAATAALLVLGGILGTSLIRMSQAELGFEPENVTIGHVALGGEALATPDRLQAFAVRALDAVRTIPGVEVAALASTAPVERGLNIPLDPPSSGLVTSTRAVDWRYVSPDYFRALRVRVHLGRVFDERDGPGSPPVIAVNQAFARVYFGRPDVLGEVIRMHESVGDAPRQIVGVVEDSLGQPGAGWTSGINARGSEPPPIVYVPAAQAPAAALRVSHQAFPVAWIVRTRPGAGDIGPALEEAVRSIDPSLAFVSVQPLQQIVADDINGPKMMATIVGMLAGTALLIAAVGIFGVVSYLTRLRRHDTAVRLALGASRATLIRSLTSELVAIVLIGGLVGVAVSIGASRLLQTRVGPLATIEPGPISIAAAVLAVVAVTAGVVPAARASRADPLATLRDGA